MLENVVNATLYFAKDALKRYSQLTKTANLTNLVHIADQYLNLIGKSTDIFCLDWKKLNLSVQNVPLTSFMKMHLITSFNATPK
jgi:hypothetical protein